jgi:acyl-CoA dehydrogenase
VSAAITRSLSDTDRLLQESSTSLFARHSDLTRVRELPSGGWLPELWSFVDGAELPLVAVAEEAGGSAGTTQQWALVLRAAARQCAPIPLAETGIAGWLLEQAGTEVGTGPLTSIAHAVPPSDQLTVPGVPYARYAKLIVIPLLTSDGCEVGTVSPDSCEITEATNLAGEPRDTITFSVADLRDRRQASPALPSQLELRWTFVRSVQIAGALETLLDISLQYARERNQFGKPIGQLPVVRERLALLAEETAAADAAADCAADGVAAEDLLAVGGAKVRAGEAATEGARLAHQVHGAIGTTREHPLHLLTTRLWSWREEAGNERWWAERIGQEVLGLGSEQLWPSLVTSGGMPAA